MTTNSTKAFSRSLKNVIEVREISQRQFARDIGFSAMYLTDVLLGNRHPSIRFVNAVCDLLRLRPRDRKEWHIAAARCHGWNV